MSRKAPAGHRLQRSALARGLDRLQPDPVVALGFGLVLFDDTATVWLSFRLMTVSLCLRELRLLSLDWLLGRHILGRLIWPPSPSGGAYQRLAAVPDPALTAGRSS